MVALVVVGLAALVVVVTQYRPLLFTTFDPEVAEASGVRVGRVDALRMLVLSLSILVTLSVIGVTLVAATLVIPAVAVRMLTPRFRTVLCLATVVGAVGGFVGMNLSYHLDVPPGTMVVVRGYGCLRRGPAGRRGAQGAYDAQTGVVSTAHARRGRCVALRQRSAVGPSAMPVYRLADAESAVVGRLTRHGTWTLARLRKT